MDDFDGDFEQVSSGASATYPKQCSALRKNEHVMLKNHPCKIVEMSTSKTGKHGHAKVHLVGLDIFDGKKYEDICPSTHNMNVPNVKRKEYTCIGVEDGFCSLMDDKGDTRDDLRASESLQKEIDKLLEADGEAVVSVLKALDDEKIMTVKKAAK